MALLMARPDSIRWDIRRFDQLDSTNLEVKRAAERDAPEGLVVTAVRQTGGYGRQGRAWASPAGSLYVSLLLRPDLAASEASKARRPSFGEAPADDAGEASVGTQGEASNETSTITFQELPSLSLVAGLAVRQAILKTFPHLDQELLCVKWPNDVLYGSDKMCGISLELVHGALCVGIGVNVFSSAGSGTVTATANTAASDKSAAGKANAAIEAAGKYRFAYAGDLACSELASTDDKAGKVDALLDALLEGFGAYYLRWCDEGFAPFVSEFTRVMAYLGQHVRMETVDGRVREEGVVRGVDEHGCLLMQMEGEPGPQAREGSFKDGGADRLRHVASGEVHFL